MVSGTCRACTGRLDELDDLAIGRYARVDVRTGHAPRPPPRPPNGGARYDALCVAGLRLVRLGFGLAFLRLALGMRASPALIASRIRG